MWKSARALHVSSADGEWMATLVSSGKTAQRVVLGPRIVLGAAAGQPNNGLAKALGISRRPALVRRRHRYRQAGAGGLFQDAPRSLNTRRIPAPSSGRRRLLRSSARSNIVDTRWGQEPGHMGAGPLDPHAVATAPAAVVMPQPRQ